MLSSGMQCYSGAKVIIWKAMLSSGANVIIWDKMLSCGANLSYGANVIIWCYLVMLSSGMITPSFLFFLKTSLTRKMDLILLSIERRLQMQFSIARRFKLQSPNVTQI